MTWDIIARATVTRQVRLEHSLPSLDARSELPFTYASWIPSLLLLYIRGRQLIREYEEWTVPVSIFRSVPLSRVNETDKVSVVKRFPNAFNIFCICCPSVFFFLRRNKVLSSFSTYVLKFCLKYLFLFPRIRYFHADFSVIQYRRKHRKNCILYRNEGATLNSLFNFLFSILELSSYL